MSCKRRGQKGKGLRLRNCEDPLHTQYTIPQRSRHETEGQPIRFSTVCTRLREKTIDDVCPSDLARHTKHPTAMREQPFSPLRENEEQAISTNTASSW